MRVVTWNIQYGLSGLGAENLADQAAALSALKPDIVFLQEADVDRSRSGNVDQPNYHAAACGLNHVRFDNAAQPSAGGGGNAILSRYRLLFSKECNCSDSVIFDNQRTIPNPTRGFCIAKTYYNGELITIVSTHLDGYSQSLRTLMIGEIQEKIVTSKAIIGGDFNTSPDSDSYNTAAGYWSDQTDGLGVDATQLDYIWTKNLSGTGAYSNTATSDHRIYYVDF